MLIVAAGCLLLVSAGCGNPGPAAPADSALARTALEQALAAWKAGDEPQSLLEQDPPIRVADEDWLAGWQLTEFQLSPDDRLVGTSLRVQVRLSLKSPQERTVVKDVRYAVGTDPTPMIVRED